MTIAAYTSTRVYYTRSIHITFLHTASIPPPPSCTGQTKLLANVLCTHLFEGLLHDMRVRRANRHQSAERDRRSWTDAEKKKDRGQYAVTM